MNLSEGARLFGRHLRPQRRALWRLGAWSVLEAVPTFASGLFIARALDDGFLADRLLVGFGWLAGLALLYTLGAWGTRQAYPWLASTVEPLRDSLLAGVVTASLRRALEGEQEVGGSSVAQATVQVEAVRGLFSALLRSSRQMLATSIAAVGGLTVLSPLLALVVGTFVLLAFGVFAVLLRTAVVRYQDVVLCGEQVGASAEPVVEGVRDVIVCAAEARAARAVGESIDAEAAAQRSFARAWMLRLPVVTLGAHVPLLALLVLAPWLLSNGYLTVGEFAGAAIYLFSGLQPAIQMLVSGGGTILVNIGVVLARLSEVSAEPPVARDGSSGLVPSGHDVELERVTFAYSPAAEPVLRDLTLAVGEGLHLAVVGPSGVGKSTLANLLVRLAGPQHGKIRLGGLDLQHVDEDHLRHTVALIPQEAYVFAGTVRENLTYLRPQASTGELEQAVSAVGMEELVSQLGGLDAEIPPSGGNLSAGERQLIALTRTYLSSARVIILDEATCHLDPVAEQRAEQAFADRHGTLIVIAHRISSALRAELILVMDGADPEVGGYDELLQSNSLFAELVGHWHEQSTDKERIAPSTVTTSMVRE